MSTKALSEATTATITAVREARLKVSLEEFGRQSGRVDEVVHLAQHLVHALFHLSHRELLQAQDSNEHSANYKLSKVK